MTWRPGPLCSPSVKCNVACWPVQACELAAARGHVARYDLCVRQHPSGWSVNEDTSNRLYDVDRPQNTNRPNPTH